MKSVNKPVNSTVNFASAMINNIIFSNKESSFDFSKIFYFSLLFILASLVIILQINGGEEQGHNIIHLVWAVEINGTNNADNISGTINKDIIKGLAGNDTINGKEVGDDISGGSGDDIIYGNKGKDVLKGKAGNDYIEGGEGKDRIYGDRGNDILVGGQDNDTLNGGLGKDTFICGNGTDILIDFNITQKDTIPENDCENQKNGDGKTKSLSLQQDSNSAVTMDGNDITDNKSNNVKTTDENKKKDDLFFGLFK
jgi:Ca2+-binding RTX toxin-like protein